MDVNGPNPVQNTFPIKQAQPAAEVPPTTEPKPATPLDKVEISPEAIMLDRMNQSPEIRAERLNQIKVQIEAGEYDTPEKLEAALEKMFGEIGLNDEIS